MNLEAQGQVKITLVTSSGDLFISYTEKVSQCSLGFYIFMLMEHIHYSSLAEPANFLLTPHTNEKHKTIY